MGMQILTANSLRSGGVVFLTAQSSWSPFISLARISDNAETGQQLELSAQRAVDEQVIVEPFLIDVVLENDVPHPVRFRERLRVGGPSVRNDFSKPSFKEVA